MRTTLTILRLILGYLLQSQEIRKLSETVQAFKCKSLQSKLTHQMKHVLKITLTLDSLNSLSFKRSNFFRCQNRCNRLTQSRNTLILTSRSQMTTPISAVLIARGFSASAASKAWGGKSLNALYKVSLIAGVPDEENSCKLLHKRESDKKSNKSSGGSLRTSVAQVTRRA